MSSVQDIISELQNSREKSEERFAVLMKLIQDTIAPLKLEITAPRTVRKSTYRANPNVSSVEDYFRVTVYIPFLENLLEQMKFRFNEKTLSAGIFDSLLPANCVKEGVLENQFLCLWRNYSHVLKANNIQPSDSNGISGLGQYRQWVTKWKREFSDSSPTTLSDTLLYCDVDVYPTIHALLTIGMLLPISTATVERSFSTLRLVKSYLRNRTTEERMNGLTLMYVYANEQLDVNKVISPLMPY